MKNCLYDCGIWGHLLPPHSPNNSEAFSRDLPVEPSGNFAVMSVLVPCLSLASCSNKGNTSKAITAFWLCVKTISMGC